MALIYVVEDDESIQEVECIALRNSNYIVEAFSHSRQFFRRLAEKVPDLILLDVMLPDGDGNEIVRRLRSDPKTKNVLIVMVTAKTTEFDMIRGLDGGADDYIKKPFSVMELLSRVKALLRRKVEEAPGCVKVGTLLLDQERHLVKAGDRNVELTYKEFELLHYLMLNQGLVLSREAIMRAVWDTDYEGETRTVDVHIKTLRQKLGEYGAWIKTVRNVGYVLK